MELFDRTHKNKAGGFVDEKSEKIYNDVAARIDERETHGAGVRRRITRRLIHNRSG